MDGGGSRIVQHRSRLRPGQSAADVQGRADALLNQAYENSTGTSAGFDYSQVSEVDGQKPWEHMEAKAYLQRMERGGLTQLHGVMMVVAVEVRALRILSISENGPQMLDNPDARLGADARMLFSEASAALLHKECGTRTTGKEPLCVALRNGGKEFYAILHKNDAGIIVDLEPLAPPDDQGLSMAGSLRDVSGAKALAQVSHRAARSISRLQALPGGDVTQLCQTVVEEMRELTGYDRVMAYKIHEDEHGEVLAESVRDDLVPYLGLHFPATDIPQAMRNLFVRVGCRMICNAASTLVKVQQVADIDEPISLADSTLRAAHGCHNQYMINMGSAASLTMAVVVNEKKDDLDPHEELKPKQKKLWGLVVCHHCTPRYAPFPLRKGCEFVMQTFGVLLNQEVLIAANKYEELVLGTQTLLCDMLEHDVPLGIVKEHPNLMDLVKCDGAALYYSGHFWLLGVTPTERQVKDIVTWLMTVHKRKVGVRTDSLAEAGFPGAEALGDAVCGMVAAKIREQDFVFWFRSHTAKEVRWGGRKHVKGEVDDGRKMHPRSSFQAFLDTVKKRSLPWNDVELDSIDSLQLMLSGSLDKLSADDLRKLEGDLAAAGATTVDGTPASGMKVLHIRAAHEPVAQLRPEIAEALARFKRSFVVTDGTREDYPIVFATPEFCSMTGYSANEILGKNLSLLMGPETEGVEAEKFNKCANRGNYYSGRHLHYKKGGALFWDLITLAPVKDSAGHVINHVVMAVELGKVTSEVSESPRYPGQTVPQPEKSMPVSLIRYDARHKDNAMRSIKELVQVLTDPTSTVTKSVADPVPIMGAPKFGAAKPDAHPAYAAEAPPNRRRSIVGRIFGGGAAAEPEAPTRTFATERLSQEQAPSEGEEGATALEREEARKRRAHKGFDMGTTLERIEKNFVITDPRLDDNPIIFASDEFLEFMGYTREEAIGSKLNILQGQDTDPLDLKAIRQVVNTEKDLPLQTLSYKKSGESFWNALYVKLVKDSEGHMQYFVGIVQDVGQAKLDDAAFRKRILEAEKTASTVTEALRDLPDASLADKLWQAHGNNVKSKPHQSENEGWAAIKQVRAQEGRLGVKHFRLIKPLGMGDTGSVLLVELRGTNQLYAMKTMEKETMIERNKVHRVAVEREILEAMDHPFLPTLYASFQTEKHICLITDFAAGGELYKLLKSQPRKQFSEATACFYASEILLALEYLHCQGIIYRDLKPENLLLSKSGHIQLIDFDLSVRTSTFPKVVRGRMEEKSKKKKKKKKSTVDEGKPMLVAEPLARSNSFVGTEEYIAPEIVSGSGHTGSVDWWAFGILLFEMLFGKTPFRGSSMPRTFNNVLNKEIAFPRDPETSDHAKDLICKLLIRNPEERLGSRYGAAEIKEHPFFAGIDWPLIRSKQVPVPQVPPNMIDEMAAATSVLGEKGMNHVTSDMSSARSSGAGSVFQDDR